MREKLPGGVLLYSGDCLEVLKRFKDNTMDSCCSDPPYHLTSIVKRFGADNAAPAKPFGKSNMQDKTWRDPQAKQFVRLTKGFMGKKWDGGDIAFRPELWTEVLRVLKPGAHLLAFGGTRTYHNMAYAIEQAGFEVRDCILWLYGTGFVKNHDVSKGIDRAAGAKREVTGTMGKAGLPTAAEDYEDNQKWSGNRRDEPMTEEAQLWNGWGSALSPAVEMIVLARKPLSEKTIAKNVLKWGTGAINVEGCRIELAGDTDPRLGGKGTWSTDKMAKNVYGSGYAGVRVGSSEKGRWPKNVILDGSDEVVGAFPDSAGAQGVVSGREPSETGQNGIYGRFTRVASLPVRKDSGSAARFFYNAKADENDRLSSKHPTIKPVDLMQYLVRLITPPNGRVLDPFAGTGTTGEAAFKEGMRAVLIERETEYQEDIRRRMILAAASTTEALQAAATLPADLKKKVETNLKRPDLFSQRGK